MDYERNNGQIDFTMPFHNYKGPGTHNIENMINNLEPTDSIDDLARHHDADYVLAENYGDILDADREFITEAKGDEGIAASILLRLKNIAKFKPDDTPINTHLTDEERMYIADLLAYRENQKHTHYQQ